MALVLWLFMALVPCLLGMGALRILYGSRTKQELSLADCILTGGIIIMGLAEAAHLGAVILGWSFSRCVNVFLVEVIVAAVSAVAVIALSGLQTVRTCCREGKSVHGGNKQGIESTEQGNEKGAKRGVWENIPWVLFFILALLQLISVATAQSVYIEGDMTLETVNSFLQSDRVYEMNPLTGKPYTLGVPLRLQILGLPTLYGALSKIFGMVTEQLVYGMVPAFVLLGTYLAYYTVAKYFFLREKGKQGMFLLLAALLLAVGDYIPEMDSFGVMHSGFRGVTIRAAILLPYTFGAILRKRYKLAVLCVLAEACIVWTFYGMGACLFVTVAMLVLNAVVKWADQRFDRREDAVC